MSTTITFTTPACAVCRKTSDVELDAEKTRLWQSGAHIQDVWPHLTATDRELLISGTHPKCWDELFLEEEDE